MRVYNILGNITTDLNKKLEEWMSREMIKDNTIRTRDIKHIVCTGTFPNFLFFIFWEPVVKPYKGKDENTKTTDKNI